MIGKWLTMGEFDEGLYDLLTCGFVKYMLHMLLLFPSPRLPAGGWFTYL
jgi:hypothetical protein